MEFFQLLTVLMAHGLATAHPSSFPLELTTSSKFIRKQKSAIFAASEGKKINLWVFSARGRCQVHVATQVVPLGPVDLLDLSRVVGHLGLGSTDVGLSIFDLAHPFNLVSEKREKVVDRARRAIDLPSDRVDPRSIDFLHIKSEISSP